MTDDVIIRLSYDQALVLSDWLDRVVGTKQFDQVVDDRAAWSAVHQIMGTLDKSLVAIFAPDYGDRLDAARARLIETLGDFGLESNDDLDEAQS
ncbi:hypothetical protein R8Z50_35350 [Longispora sp. K20-0274]|uniref:hypothetical protein n=1 Tax=Longispora sp. K20-0274 TaxID=3088255 RepID=UPI00399BFD3B